MVESRWGRVEREKGNEGLLDEWRAQQEGYEKEERRRIMSRVGGKELVEELEEKLQKWSRGCKICMAIGGERGRRCTGESWERCDFVTAVEREAMERGIEGSKRIPLDIWGGCWTCWMPKVGCRRYNEDGRNRGGFVRYKDVVGGKCQWGRELKDICVALVMFHPSREIERRWERSSVDEAGWGKVEEKHKVGISQELEGVMKGMVWLGGKVKVRGVEMHEGSSMVLMMG